MKSQLRSNFLTRFCLAAFCGVAAQLAHAAPNGLNQIPIAKVFGDGGVALSVAQTDEASSSTVFTSQFGLYNISEVGVDYVAAPTGEQAALGNIKLLVLHKQRKFPDVAVGLQNLAYHQKGVPYAVATTQPGNIGFSLGVIQPATNGWEGMGGVSYTLSPTWQILADTVRGWSNYTTLGVLVNVTPSIQFNVAYAQGNETSTAPNGYILNLAYVFHLGHGGLTHGKDLSGDNGVPSNARPTGGNGVGTSGSNGAGSSSGGSKNPASGGAAH